MDDYLTDMPETEKRIFTAAVDIFSKKGFAGSTTKDIAKEAGVAEGTIFRYYKTKKSILAHITKKMVDIIGELALRPMEEIMEKSGGKTFKEVLREIIYGRFELVDKIYPIVSIVFSEMLFYKEILFAVYDKILKKAERVFERFYSGMVEKGMITGGLPANAAFRTIIANIFMFIAQYKLMPEEIDTKNLDKELDILIEVIINGVA